MAQSKDGPSVPNPKAMCSCTVYTYTRQARVGTQEMERPIMDSTTPMCCRFQRPKVDPFLGSSRGFRYMCLKEATKLQLWGVSELLGVAPPPPQNASQHGTYRKYIYVCMYIYIYMYACIYMST